MLTACFINTPKAARTRVGSGNNPEPRNFEAHEGQLGSTLYASTAGPSNSFKCLDVFGEGLAARFGDAIEGLRLAQHELLFDTTYPASSSLSSCAPGCRLWRQSWRGAMKLSLFHILVAPLLVVLPLRSDQLRQRSKRPGIELIRVVATVLSCPRRICAAPNS
jgi:hypothetical protein